MRAYPRKEKAPYSDEAYSRTINCELQANDTHTNNKPQQCKHFDRCNAPICPMDCQWHKRTHLDGEPVCIYLRELAKPNGKDTLGPSLQALMLECIEQQAEGISSRWGDIRRRLQRASKQGSKTGHGKTLRGASNGK